MTRLPFDPDLASPSDGREPAPNRLVSGRLWRDLAPVLSVSAGGAVGGCSRYGLDQLIPASDRGFPWGTFTVNVTGAFLLAVLLVLVVEAWTHTRLLRPFIAVGVLGSFTTFSTLIVDVDKLFVGGAGSTAATYLVGSIVAGLAATSAGLIIGRGVVSYRQRCTREVAR